MTITVEFFAPPGQSLTLLLCPYGTYGSDAPANGAGTAAVETARAGMYRATVTQSLTGRHTAHAAAAEWELPLGRVTLAAGQTCRVGDDQAVLAAQIDALDVVPAAAVSTPVAGTLSMLRGDLFVATISGLFGLAGRTHLWWTVKADPGRQSDAEARLQITEAEGLLRLNGAAHETPAEGSLTVDEEAGTVVIVVAAAVTAQLSAGQRWSWDLQILDADGDAVTLAEGTITIRADVTRAVAVD